MIPTFFGTTLLVFLILQLVPSGPFEQAILQIKMSKMYSGEAQTMEASGDDGGTMELSPKVLDRLRRQYGLDKPIWKRYFIWLGLAKKEIKNKEIEVGVPFRETIKDLGEGEYVSISLQRWVFIYEDENANFIILESPEGTDFEWITDEYQVLPDPEYIEEWNESNWIIKDDVENDEGILTLIKEKRQGVFTGYLGESSKHKEDVSTLIWDRIHISSFLGITGFILSYLVCIPLGIMKALKHGSKFDIIKFNHFNPPTTFEIVRHRRYRFSKICTVVAFRGGGTDYM